MDNDCFIHHDAKLLGHVSNNLNYFVRFVRHNNKSATTVRTVL
jgi:hypothetical protein